MIFHTFDQNPYLKNAIDITSSYFCVRLRRSSSDISGLKTTIVSYLRSPGGHWGSSFSSIAMDDPGMIGGSSSPLNPPSKNVPEKSKVCALIDNLEILLCCWTNFCDVGNEFRERLNEKSEGERELRAAGYIREEEAIFILRSSVLRFWAFFSGFLNLMFWFG